jgi:hypothetical protein
MVADLEPEYVERNARLDGPIHEWFGLTYANYQVIPRTLMQSMPVEWQERMVTCLRELDAAYAHLDHPPGYWIRAHGLGGQFIKDPVPHYNRGRTFLPPGAP